MVKDVRLLSYGIGESFTRGISLVKKLTLVQIH